MYGPVSRSRVDGFEALFTSLPAAIYPFFYLRFCPSVQRDVLSTQLSYDSNLILRSTNRSDPCSSIFFPLQDFAARY